MHTHTSYYIPAREARGGLRGFRVDIYDFIYIHIHTHTHTHTSYYIPGREARGGLRGFRVFAAVGRGGGGGAVGSRAGGVLLHTFLALSVETPRPA